MMQHHSVHRSMHDLLHVILQESYLQVTTFCRVKQSFQKCNRNDNILNEISLEKYGVFDTIVHLSAFVTFLFHNNQYYMIYPKLREL